MKLQLALTISEVEAVLDDKTPGAIIPYYIKGYSDYLEENFPKKNKYILAEEIPRLGGRFIVVWAGTFAPVRIKRTSFVFGTDKQTVEVTLELLQREDWEPI